MWYLFLLAGLVAGSLAGSPRQFAALFLGTLALVFSVGAVITFSR